MESPTRPMTADPWVGNLYINIYQAYNLPNMDFMSKSDPFVKLTANYTTKYGFLNSFLHNNLLFFVFFYFQWFLAIFDNLGILSVWSFLTQFIGHQTTTFRTRTIPNSLHPLWDEIFILPIEDGQGRPISFELEVFDEDPRAVRKTNKEKISNLLNSCVFVFPFYVINL